jgi:uncharacterized protein
MLKKLFITFLCLFSYSANSAVTEIKIGAGIMHGVYYPAAIQMCNLLTKYSPVTKCEVLPTNGSLNNLNLLTTSKVDFAFIQADIARDAYKSNGIFANQKSYEDLRLVLNLFPEVFTIIVKDESGIVNFSDLENKKIGINLRGSGAKTGFINSLKQFKFLKDPEIIQTSDSQFPKRLCDNEVDAVVLFTGHPSGLIREITDKCDVEFVTIDPFKLENILADNGVYEKFIIPKEMYKNISRNASSFAGKSLLVSTKSTDPEKVKLLSKIISRNFEEFKTMYPVLQSLSKQDVIGNGPIPIYE